MDLEREREKREKGARERGKERERAREIKGAKERM